MKTFIFGCLLLTTLVHAQVMTISGNATLQGTFTISSGSASAGLSGSPMFGYTETSTSKGSAVPSVSYGMQRLWDSSSMQWPSVSTCPSYDSKGTVCNTTTNPPTYLWTNLDTMLANDQSNGVTEVMYTLARTPTWASASPNDSTSCHDTGTKSGQGNGECYPPYDLNADGSGENAIWKDWITQVATHSNDHNYLYGSTKHAHIRYYEIWNEPDGTCNSTSQCFFKGSFAQLARLTEDARCIILGSEGGMNVIHDKGDGTATPCSATAIDTTALIVMSSTHAKDGQSIEYTQNELYCSSTSDLTGNRAYQLPCPNPKTATAAAIDVINVHMKPGNEGTTTSHCGPKGTSLCSVETGMQLYVASIQAVLQPLELLKPFWDGEASYCPMGFTDSNCTSYGNKDLAASFFPRFYLINWSLGISGAAFYDWDELTSQAGTQGETSMQQTINWLGGSTLTTPCTATGTVWSCTITKAGVQYGIIWDSSQTCTGTSGNCTTKAQTMASSWGHYQDMTSASTPSLLPGSKSIQLGIKPVLLSW
jgi:hypothetical protein